MKATSRGSLLIELLLATIITGFVISAAMEAYRQILKIEQKINKKNTADFNLQRVQEQLCNDFSCAFIPSFYEPKSEQNSKVKNDQKDEPIFFFATNDEYFYRSKIFGLKMAKTSIFSFCATSPMIFGHKNPPRVVRITYLLEKSKKQLPDKDLFDLYRIESKNLANPPNKKELETLTKVLLIKEIDEFTISFVPKKDHEDKDDSFRTIQMNGQSIVVSNFVIKEVFDWGNQSNNDRKKENEKNINRLPQAIIARLAMTFEGKPKYFEIYVKIESLEQGKDKKENAKDKKGSQEAEKTDDKNKDKLAEKGASSDFLDAKASELLDVGAIAPSQTQGESSDAAPAT